MSEMLPRKTCVYYILIIAACLYLVIRLEHDKSNLCYFYSGLDNQSDRILQTRSGVSDIAAVQDVNEILTNLSDNPVVKTVTYSKMNVDYLYILGVAGGNTSDNVSWDIFKIYASVSRQFVRQKRASCCFKFNSENKKYFLEIPAISIQQLWARTVFTAVHYTCENPRKGLIPSGVGITVGNVNCKEVHVDYVRPFLPLREPGTTLAISTKAAYGNVSAEQIIEWMETYKYLGVDKVVTHYLNNINEDALKVLKHYASSGILDLYYHEPAASDIYPRIFKNNVVQFCNDKQMAVYDSFEKMSGYTYFGVIDHDEFLIPSGNKSLKQMLADLSRVNATAAGFVFMSQYYYLSWGPSGDVNNLMLGRYISREDSDPRLDQEKLIFKTKEAKPGTVHTHKIDPKDGHELQVVPSKDGFIRHFRHCRRSVENACLHEYTRIKDTSVAEWSQRIRESVESVRLQVFGTKAKTFSFHESVD